MRSVHGICGSAHGTARTRDLAEVDQLASETSIQRQPPPELSAKLDDLAVHVLHHWAAQMSYELSHVSRW